MGTRASDEAKGGEFREWIEKEYLKVIGGIAATAILSGGFVMGLHRRKARELHELEREKLRKGLKVAVPRPASTRTPTITWWERAIGVKSAKMSPGAAARSALLGGTILATTGCSVIILGIAAATGVSSFSEFYAKMSIVVPRFRRNVADFFGIEPRAGPTPEQQEQERQEMALFDSIFAEDDSESNNPSS
ncbi:hypothetical protein Ae201684_001543 [Aphanomyces euteiches]|uniref:Transmembrane protein 242 n=1 Tax=Aphanomyces euteiches TaxID=100861 RepID=A0A6G0XTY8_9STRA|nr:hypothetical protein Ae201684_001543 [Aphanomyces euteiches]KAH9140924.1 hypothetical protein AeRB84_014869 [Aphanomyces euteiches]